MDIMQSKKELKKMSNRFDYMYKRELINRRALMFFSIFENVSYNNTAELTVPDLCIGLYSDCIDPFKFISSIADQEYTSDEDVTMKMAKWLEENYYIFWLLTCECVDDLLKRGKVKYNEKGYLCLVKQRKQKSRLQKNS